MFTAIVDRIMPEHVSRYLCGCSIIYNRSERKYSSMFDPLKTSDKKEPNTAKKETSPRTTWAPRVLKIKNSAHSTEHTLLFKRT